MGEVWWSLANLKTVRFSEQDIAAMEHALGRSDLKDDDRFHIEFALGKALQQRQTPLADDTVSGFGDDAIDTADLARFHPDRVVRHVEVGFLQKAVAFYLEE